MIPIAKPFLGEQEAAAARRVILSGWTTQGPEVAAFEREFAECVGAPHPCAVSSCTMALHLALLAAGVGPGAEVITVSHSYIATANSVRYCGAIPVFVDIRADQFNIDPDLIEDAACAIGSEILWEGKWERVGKPHGDVACFSFHPRKVLSTGDGGMITTRHKEWDARFRLLRQHGMAIPDTVRHASNTVIFESYPEIGFNYRMTDIQAAVGREQLKRLPEFLRRRREIAAEYRVLLDDMTELGLPNEPDWARSNWQSFCVRLPQGVPQRQVMQTLLDRGIATRRGIMCAHREPAYQHQEWRSAGKLSESERAQEECILLPIHHQLTKEEQALIASTLREVITAECSV